VGEQRLRVPLGSAAPPVGLQRRGLGFGAVAPIAGAVGGGSPTQIAVKATPGYGGINVFI